MNDNFSTLRSDVGPGHKWRRTAAYWECEFCFLRGHWEGAALSCSKALAFGRHRADQKKKAAKEKERSADEHMAPPPAGDHGIPSSSSSTPNAGQPGPEAIPGS